MTLIKLELNLLHELRRECETLLDLKSIISKIQGGTTLPGYNLRDGILYFQGRYYVRKFQH